MIERASRAEHAQVAGCCDGKHAPAADSGLVRQRLAAHVDKGGVAVVAQERSAAVQNELAGALCVFRRAVDRVRRQGLGRHGTACEEPTLAASSGDGSCQYLTWRWPTVTRALPFALNFMASTCVDKRENTGGQGAQRRLLAWD